MIIETAKEVLEIEADSILNLCKSINYSFDPLYTIFPDISLLITVNILKKGRVTIYWAAEEAWEEECIIQES